MMNHPKRLNDNFLWQDLEEYLNDEIFKGINGSFSDVIQWMSSYSRNVESCKKEITDAFSKLFPKAIVCIENGYDDDSVYFVKIHGIENSEENKRSAYDLSEKFEGDFKETYLVIPRIVDIEKTQKYYPEIYQEYVKKNTPNIP